MAKGVKREILKRKQFRRPPKFVEHNEAGEKAEFVDFDRLNINYKARREMFCREYIKDFNGAQTLYRMGYRWNRASAGRRASQWLSEPYTQYALQRLMDKLDEAAIISRNEILLGLKREAHEIGEQGSHAARISAWRTLAKILGMEIIKIEGNLTGSGVMAVPYVGSLEDWERQTKQAQAELKKRVRE